LSDLSLILLAAGSSLRFGLDVKKQWLRVGDNPLWLFVAKELESMVDFQKVIITASNKEVALMRHYCDYMVIEGGKERQESLQKALNFIETPYVLVHDAARVCVQKEVIDRLIKEKKRAPSIVPAIKPADTVVYRNETINRDEVLLIQTPQLSHTDTLRQALNTPTLFTDESSAIKALGKEVLYIPGDPKQKKLTFKEDLLLLPCLKPPAKKELVGQGFDVHAFCDNRPLKLCGIEIPFSKGLAGHSDADVAIHALIDALLGAAGFGDIGELFPDSDSSYKNIDSTLLLKDVVTLLKKTGFYTINIDLTLIAQAPKLAPYKDAMRSNLAKILQIPKANCNIKATTTEKLGFIGRKEGIAALATATGITSIKRISKGFGII